MTTLAIIGRGRAATVHAEAIRMIHGAELAGVGGETPGRPSQLALAMDCADLPLPELIERADAIIVAVPPRAVADVLTQIPTDRAILVESPIGTTGVPSFADRPRALVAANLLHAPVVRKALRAITELGPVHHMVLRASSIRPRWHRGPGDGSGVTGDLGARLLPILLAAAGAGVDGVAAETTSDDHGCDLSSALSIALDDGRTIRATLAWTDQPPTADLEAAGATGVVSLDLWPRPHLQLDGTTVADAGNDPALVALGFVDQLHRLLTIARGDARPWPPLRVGNDVLHIVDRASESNRIGEFCQLHRHN